MTDQQNVDVTLPRRAAGVREGREALAPLRAGLGLRYDDLRLLVSEVLTNAVLHGEGETMRLKATLTETGCLVEVIDEGEGFEPPKPAPSMPDSTPGGRGLALLDRVASGWGVYEGGSTHVWFQVPYER